MPSDEMVEKVARAIPDEAIDAATNAYIAEVSRLQELSGDAPSRPPMRAAIAAALSAAHAEPVAAEAAIRADEREKCARIADNGMLVPPDGGAPTQGECDVAARIATAIRARGGSDENV